MDRLSAGYGDDERVESWLSTVETWAKRLSYGFDAYGAGGEGEPERNGPGLYVALVSTNEIEGIADSPEANPFSERDGPQYVPLEVEEEVPEAEIPDEDIDDIYSGIKEVANDMDQAMVVWMNGRIHEDNVRFLSPDEDELSHDVSDTEGGTRHQSAIETSARPEVEYTLTLSEEDGSIRIFQDGEQYSRTIERDDIVEAFEDD